MRWEGFHPPDAPLTPEELARFRQIVGSEKANTHPALVRRYLAKWQASQSKVSPLASPPPSSTPYEVWRDMEKEFAQARQYEEFFRKFEREAHFSRQRSLKVIGASLLLYAGVETARLVASHHAKGKREDRQTQIEGLRHGGQQAQLRHALTDFGSGWRGLVSLSEQEFKGLLGPAIPFQAATLPAETVTGLADYLRKNKPGLAGLSEKTHGELQAAVDYFQKTGFSPVLVNREGLRQVAPETRRALLRHERMHALHFKQPQHPFFAQKLAGTPDLEGVYEEARLKQWLYDHKSFHGTPVRKPETVEKYRVKSRAEAREIAELYEEQYGELPNRELLWNSERLAYSNQFSKQFFGEAKKAGLNLPQSVRRPVSKQVSQAAEKPWRASEAAAQTIRDFDAGHYPALPKSNPAIATRASETLPLKALAPYRRIATVGAGIVVAAVVARKMLSHDNEDNQTMRERRLRVSGARRTSAAL